MKSIVTGGAGFIGSHVVEQLLGRGTEVVVIDNFSTGRPENLSEFSGSVRLVEADISTPGSWMAEFKGVDHVFHLAALADIVPSIENPVSYYRSNVDGTFNVLEAARAASVEKLVYAASSSCYGIPDEFPTKETAEIRPQYPYALTKYLGEELVRHWNQVYDLPAISLRLFNVYGTRSRTSGTYGAVFGVFLAQKLAGKPFTVVGDGKQTRDFTYVSDVAAAFISAAMSSLSGGVFNVGSGRTVSINELVELLGGPVTHIPKRPGEPDCTFADIAKITAALDWRPRVPIADGVREVVANIDYWAQAPVWTPESIEVATRQWFEYLGDK
jgi:UDP-glucose 4-epimerase